MSKYDFSKIEKKWQAEWKKTNYGKGVDNDKKPKHYHLVEFPYPSGAGLHVGHCMGYGASDAYCRMKRMQGFNVMFPIGWDAFGLPTENYAIKHKIQPSKATADNIKVFKNQMESLGFSFDWSREINTTDPNYYKWTQWIFLQFYKHTVVNGKLIEVSDDDKITPRLAFQAEMPVNWCPKCKINLANEEVVSGNCERCGSKTEKRMQKQWMLRITAYADRLISDLDNVDYEERIKTQQINWIGRSEGAKIKFNLKSHLPADATPQALQAGNSNLKINENNLFLKVFTTRPDTLFGCTFMAISPEHNIISNLKSPACRSMASAGRQISPHQAGPLDAENYKEVTDYIVESRKKSDIERSDATKEKTGVELKGIKAINPINGKEIPIFVADYVLAGYGTGAVMCVPAHDERDFEFAKKYEIDIIEVISPTNHDCDNDKPFINYGILINSGEYSGLSSIVGGKKIIKKLKNDGVADFATNYKLRDWIFSRQHYWGEPIPIVYCQKCGMVPVPEDQLPVVLPEVKNYEPTDTGESPLAKIDNWVNTKCPKCGGEAKRETDTMPNWAGSSWYYLRYCDPHNVNQFASMKKMSYWLSPKLVDGRAPRSPKGEGGVDIYNGGMEHTTLHLLYSRFWHKFLYDLKVVPNPEPYQKRIAHGIILGADKQKMSKSRGNTIDPLDIIKQFGADTLRAYIMFIGPYDQESVWSMDGVMGVFRFLNKVRANFNKVSKEKADDKIILEINKLIKDVSNDLERFSLNTYIAKLMEFNNILTGMTKISNDTLKIFAILFSPALPHLACELWQQLGNQGSIFDNSWPKFDQKIIQTEKIEIPIQVNGKIKDRLTVKSDISDTELEKLALKSDVIIKLLSGNKPKKVIVAPKRLISIVQ